MSEARSAAGAAHRVGSGSVRLVRAWKALPHESRLAAFASGALFLTLFLPWYQVTLIAPAKAAKLQSASASITGWGAFSFVEAAVLLVAAGVVILLFQRAEGRAFHLPGGDGGVITAAGLWTCVLIIWRIFDKQGATTNGPSATTSGIEWGIFVALGAAAFLAYAGSRIRAAHRPEPPLPGEAGAPAGSNAAATTAILATDRRTRRSAAAPTTAGAEARESRRRARWPQPVSADRPARVADRPARVADRPPVARAERPSYAADRRPEYAVSPPDIPPTARRRRASPDELFERVVPEDPPAVPFGRIPRADDPTITRSAPPATPAGGAENAPADEQLSIRFDRRHTPPDEADETLPGDTLPLRGDDTLPLRDDDTRTLGGDETLPLERDDTLPLRADETVPLGEDDTLPDGDDDTLPLDRRRKRR